MLQSLNRSWWVGLLALVLGACGSSPDGKKGGPDGKPEKVEILSFSADAGTVVEGTSVTLSWQTRHAAQVVILANGASVDLSGAEVSSGTVAVTLDETTDFVLRASGPGGSAEAGPVTVEVTPKGTLAILAFAVAPDEIDEGEPVTFSWRTSHAEAVAIHASGGDVVDLGDATAEEGEATIHPMAGDTYTLRASRGEETVTEEVVVRIKGAPTASLQVSSDRVIWGESVSLTWETEGATSVRIERDGVSIHETTDAVGELSDVPNLSATYSVVASRGEKVHRAAATVEVEPVVISFEVLEEEPTPVGGSVRIAWNVGGATHLTLTNQEGFEQTVEVDSPSEGSLEVPMGSEGRFGLVASSGAAETMAEEATHVVLDPPVIGSFTADRAVVSADTGETVDVTLSWSGVERAGALQLVADTLGPIDLGASSLEAGSVRVSISEDTHFELQATNAAGEAEAAAVVVVVPFPSIDLFAASSTYVGSMEAFELSWSTSGAAAIELTAGGIPVDGVTEDQLLGTISLQIPVATSYVLRATNEAMDFVEATVAVTVGDPQNLSFEVQPAYVAVGGTLSFTWTNLGGRTLEVRDAADAVVCSTADLGEIAAGGCSATITSEGSHAFTLEVANTVGQQDTSQASVLASAGPMITSFSAAPDAITAGGDVTFSWEVVNDPDGEAPTLTLSDGTNSFDLSDVDPNQGSKAFPLTTAGTHTFTFTATTAMGAKTATAPVTVHGQPAVTLVASASEYDLSTPITLSWTSEHATSLVLYTVGAGGSLTAIYTAPEAARAAGSFDVIPGGPTTYRAVATNALGVEAEHDVTVTVAPPQILSFTATPTEVVQGEDVTLAWTTNRTDEVSLSLFDGMLVNETMEPFVDISSTGTLLAMTNTCGTNALDEGCGDIQFPAGFTFPFGGQQQTQTRVMVNGHLGFSMGWTSNSWSNSKFPASGTYAGNAHIAPFWDDLYANMGNLYYEFGADSSGQFLIVQWANVGISSSTGGLNFQVILRADGGFDLRYGSMTASTQARADGSSATIGYQTPDGSEYHNLHFGAAASSTGPTIPGGFSNRSWSFRHVTLEPSGTFTFQAPATDLAVTLTANGPGGARTADVSITGHPRAQLVVTVPSAELDAGSDLTLSWTTSHADSLVVEDETGAAVCLVDPADVAAGSCTITEALPGIYTYFVKATGALGHVVIEEVERQFFHPFDLVSFEVDSASVQANVPVTLSWVAAGAASASLLANGVEVFPVGSDPNLGSFTTDPLVEKTTFVFEITTTDGRKRSMSRTVEVRTFDLELAASATDVVPGTPVTITFDFDTFAPGAVKAPANGEPMVEVDLALEPDAEFLDISATGTQLSLSSYRALIDLSAEGFSFPFGNGLYSVLSLNRSGFLTFDPAHAAYSYANTELPSTTTNGKKAHLAINWGDLLATGAQYFYQYFSEPAGNYVIVQWTGINHDGSGTQDMNFQIVLYEDGSFEYRYGDMLPTDNDLANGARKTIGYQVPGGGAWQFHFGAGWNTGTPTPITGGLSHRTLRFTPSDALTSVVVVPEDTSTYTYCAMLGGYSQCKDITIEAAWEILSFDSSADTIDPGQQVTLSWETKNAEVLSLTANGIDVPLSQAIWQLGTYVDSPTETTTYVLTLESLGRTKTKTIMVEVRTFSLTLDTSATTVFPGDQVTISWDVSSFGADQPAMMLPLFEIPSASAPYVDISVDQDAVQLIGANVDSTVANHSFADGFVFPFDGVDRTSVRVSTDGFLSFDTSTSTTSGNTTLPNSGTSQKRIHIAPFWDDLHTRASGRVHALATSSGSYVIQWSHISKYTGSSTTTEYDLNFQVELYADGSFEFRYGTMDNHTADSTSCYPTRDCRGDADGASATIGYQNLAGTRGSLLHFGGGSQSSSQKPFEGGLTDRTFFVPSDASGSVTVPVIGSRDYTLCAWLDGYETCETIKVKVPAQGDVVVSEIMLSPNSGEPAWIEIFNRSGVDLDLGGWTVALDGVTHTITGPIVVPVDGFAVFSMGPGIGFVEDVDLGGVFAIDPFQGSFQIHAGTLEVASIAWDAAWMPLQGVSRQVPGSKLAWSLGVGDDKLLCNSTEAYHGASLGTPGAAAPSSCLARGTERYVANLGGTAQLYDIAATGTQLFSAYRTEATLPLGFTFPFFDELVTEITVTSTGFLTIGAGTHNWESEPLPVSGTLAASGMIAPFWGSFSYASNPTAFASAEARVIGGQNVMIVQWTQIHDLSLSSNYLTVQAQLWEDGTIVFGYFDLVGTNPVVNGSQVTIGIQAPGVSEFLEISHHHPVVSEGTVFVISPVP